MWLIKNKLLKTSLLYKKKKINHVRLEWGIKWHSCGNFQITGEKLIEIMTLKI